MALCIIYNLVEGQISLKKWLTTETLLLLLLGIDMVPTHVNMAFH
jgi:hypothetical protein